MYISYIYIYMCSVCVYWFVLMHINFLGVFNTNTVLLKQIEMVLFNLKLMGIKEFSQDYGRK